MKKFIIGLGIFGVFVVYSLGIRHQQPVVGKPTAISTGSRTASPNSNTAPSSNSNNSSSTTPSTSLTGYKDGTYTGTSADAYYGNVQVAATIQNGKITDVKFLQYPDTHQTSVYINQQAMPYLQQEAIQAQSSHVNVITGATFTSQAFAQSLASALSQA